MKCIFNLEIDCPSYEAQNQLGYKPNLKEIQEKECPQCPNGPSSFEINGGSIRQKVHSRGNYIF